MTSTPPPVEVAKKIRYGGPISELTKSAALPLHLSDRIAAAQVIAQATGQTFTKDKPDKKEIEGTLEAFLQYLLDNERYQDAATLLWPPALFSAEPRVVGELFDAMFENVTLMVPGASSMGKSYNLGVWHYLDWRRDPLYTSVQMIGPSENHLQKNLFTHLVKLHRQASIKFAGAEVMQLGITTDPHERASGIFGVVIPLGKKAPGRLQGMKAPTRPKPHPVLGPLGRIRVMLEEAENIPVGIWEDVTNILSNVSGLERFKISAPFNPKDPNGPCAQRCEPVDGWQSVDMDSSFYWKSKRGWGVYRIDAYRSENVVLGYEKYPGMQTKEGLEALIANAGGVSTPGYYCADVATEVMSRRGWLAHYELKVGDEIYTVNPKTGLAEWQPVQEVFAKEFDGDLMSLEGRGFSALVTSNHRWAVCSKPSQSQSLRFVETSSLKDFDHIPLGRPAAQHGPIHDPVFAELVGWVQADGTIPPAGDGQRVTLYQSHRANAVKCARIRELLNAAGAEWGEKQRPDGISVFRFAGHFARRIREALQDTRKCASYEFVESLDYESLEALWRGLRMGDGGVAGGSNEYICTARPSEAEVFQFIAARLGFATTTHERMAGGNVISANGRQTEPCRMWYVQRRLSTHTRGQNIRREAVPYRGIVWCPRTVNGTFLAKRNGTTYFTGNTMARGWFPPSGVDLAVIPQHLMHTVVGEYVFTNTPEVCAGVDVALEGEDTAIMCLGRCGHASGWRMPATTKEPKGEFVAFKNAVGQPVRKYVVQLDSIFNLPKGDTTRLVAAIIDTSRKAAVNGNYLGVDRTGNGAGVHDILVATYHAGTKGVNPSTSPTEKRIMQEDQKVPGDEYAWLISEMWFAVRKFIEYGYLKLHPNVPQDPLFHELTGRKTEPGGAKTKVESKKAYKSRGNRSPDRADALTIMLHAVRLNLAGPPTATNAGITERLGVARQRISSIYRPEKPL